MVFDKEEQNQHVNLNSNISAKYAIIFAHRDVARADFFPSRIQNPLAGISRDALMSQVADFAAEKDLSDLLPLLQRGALIAQDPPAFEEITELEPLEREALRNEVLHKWRQPKSLYLTVILCSIGAAVQGWDQTGSNGANLSFPIEFGIGSTSERDTWLVGLVNSGPYIGSALMYVPSTSYHCIIF